MVYNRHISYFKKVEHKLKLAWKFITRSKSPNSILPFDKILDKKVSLSKEGILNYPEHFNWKTEAFKQKHTFVSYSKLLNSNEFDYRNTYFSSQLFKKDRFKRSGVFPIETKYLYSLENANALGLYGIVFDPFTRSVVKETVLHYFLPAKHNNYLNAVWLPKPTALDGLGILLAHPGSDGGFYHFLLESLGKIMLLNDKVNPDYYLLPGPSTPWKIKWLAFFDIDVNKVIWLENNSNIGVNQLIFTSPVITDQRADSILVDCFKTAANKFIEINTAEHHNLPKKIWLTRKNNQVRHVEWENMLITNTDIVPIEFSELSLTETIAICKNAELIIGPHGAAFVHLLFCDNARVIELFPDKNIQPIYSRLSEQLGLNYQAAIVNFTDPDKDNDYENLKNIIVKFLVNE